MCCGWFGKLEVARWVAKCCSILPSWPLFLQDSFSLQWGGTQRFKAKLGDAPVQSAAFPHLGCNLHFFVPDQTCGWVCESAGRATTVFQVVLVGLQRCSGSQGCSLPDSCGSFNRLWNFGMKLFKPSDNTTHLQVPFSTTNIHCTAFFSYNAD